MTKEKASILKRLIVKYAEANADLRVAVNSERRLPHETIPQEVMDRYNQTQFDLHVAIDEEVDG